MTLVPILRVFGIFGDDIRLVGGCVRDILSGGTPKDLDFCTPMLPDQIIREFECNGVNAYDLSNGHGTITATIEGEVVEVTTLRIDEETDGRFAKVKFIEDWQADAARRDFTINAMGMDRHGAIYDYFGGKVDLNLGIVRFVGDADERIQEDYLRIIRYFRFWQRYGNDKDPFTDEAIARNVEGLKQVSIERVWSEFKKLNYSGLNDVMDYMKELGVLDVVGLKG